MTIPTLPPAPSRGDANFASTADTFLAALAPWGVAVDATGVEVDTKAAEVYAKAYGQDSEFAIRAGRKIGGFSAPGGSEAKRRMLEMEGVDVAPPKPVQQSLAL